ARLVSVRRAAQRGRGLCGFRGQQRTWLQDRAGDRPRACRLAAHRQGRGRLPPVQSRPHRARQSIRAILRGQSGLAFMALLEVKGLRRRFGGVTALDGADLTVEEGRITGLIGPNGAGKTTLFNAVTGALRPNDGTVTFDGTDVTGWRADRLAGIGLSRTFQVARGLV